jgi:hypothetical protein
MVNIITDYFTLWLFLNLHFHLMKNFFQGTRKRYLVIGIKGKVACDGFLKTISSYPN